MPAKKGAEREGEDPGARDPDAETGGGKLVFADGQHGAAERGMLQPPAHEERQQHEAVDPPGGGERRQAAEAQRAAGDAVEVHSQALDDEDETQRRDGEVVAAQPEHGEADDDGDKRGEKSSGQKGWKEAPFLHRQEGRQVRQHQPLARRRHDKDRGHVTADGHEGGMAQREQAGEAVGDVEADREDHVDPDEHDDGERIGVEDRARPEDEACADDGKGGELRQEGVASAHARVSWLRPSRPFGRTSSTMISAPKTKALR